jgi:hypothetical protein
MAWEKADVEINKEAAIDAAKTDRCAHCKESFLILSL